MPKIDAQAGHEQMFQDLLALAKKYCSDGFTPVELLCVSANIVGKVMAMQDQRVMTPRRAIEIVTQNIELGNQQMVEQFAQQPTQGNA